MFVYSVSEASSLHYLSQWIKDTQNFAPNAIRMLLGNKTDIEPLEIDEMTSKSYASAHEFDLHYQISCKTNSGIGDAFEQLARSLHKPGSRTQASSSQTGIQKLGDSKEELQDTSNKGQCVC